MVLDNRRHVDRCARVCDTKLARSAIAWRVPFHTPVLLHPIRVLIFCRRPDIVIAPPTRIASHSCRKPPLSIRTPRLRRRQARPPREAGDSVAAEAGEEPHPATRPVTTVARLDTFRVSVPTPVWKGKNVPLSTSRDRSTAVASTAVKWDTSRRSAPSPPGTKPVTTVEGTDTFHVIAPPRE